MAMHRGKLVRNQGRIGVRLTLAAGLGLMLLAAARPAAAEVRAQDIAHLQGQRTNRLQGFGLVVGLKGSGDGGQYANTMRALMSLHRRYEQPVIDLRDLKTNANVALVAVEALIPEYGGREGQTLDVVVSCIGPAKSLEGGQLLTTPLQDATLTVPDIFALAGGRMELPDPKTPTRAIIRRGATLEQDFFYNFIEDQQITLVLDDAQAGFPMAQMLARAINHELANPSVDGVYERNADGALVVQGDMAVAIGPKNVRIRIPSYELPSPAAFISRVLQAPLFVMPQQAARVVINRSSKNIAFTGTVTISPTVLQIPGIGAVTIGGGGESSAEKSANPNVIGLDTDKTAGVEFQELMDTLAQLKLSPQQMVDAVEQLHRAGTLHAQLIYAE